MKKPNIILISCGQRGFIDISSPEHRQELGAKVIRLDGISTIGSEILNRKPALILLEHGTVKDQDLIKELTIPELENRIPVIVMYLQNQKVKPAYASDYYGWVEYIQYPIPVKGLISKINRYLASHTDNELPDADNARLSHLESEKHIIEEKLNQSQNLIMLGRLASGVAHDFNNVLGGILGYAEMAKFRFGRTNSSLEKYTDSIISFSKRAGDLTKEILTFARGSKNKYESINIHNLLSEVQDLLSHSIDKKYQIKKDLQAESAMIVGDPGLIQNAVINIVLNARDAMPSGGAIRFITQNEELDTKAAKKLSKDLEPGPYISLSISDSGTGMDAKTLAQVFKPFYTTKERGKGTGLGLSSVMNTVIKHKGAILVDSVPEQGTTFKIFFPLGFPEEIQGKESSETQFLRGFGHLLIVDDEEALREIISGMLSDYGYKISTAADGIEAVEFYKEHAATIDLVIIDMNLPRCTGRECFLALKAINPKVKAIVSTGFNLNEETEQVLEEGVLGFIQKPFEMKRLLRLISEVLE